MAKVPGIFCIESDWSSNLQIHGHVAVRPLLELLERCAEIPYIHRVVPTRDGLKTYVDKWCQKRYNTHPVLYLCSHGGKQELYFADGRRIDNVVDLKWLIDTYGGGKWRNRYVHVSACKFMNGHERRFKSLLNATGALAISGYEADVDFLKASAFELLLLDVLSDSSIHANSARSARNKVRIESGKLWRELGFRMITR